MIARTRAAKVASALARILVAAAWLAAPAIVRASIGGLDPTFGTGGIVTTDISGGFRHDEGLAMAVDGSGRILVAGYSTTASSSAALTVARYTAGGTLDGTFGAGGTVVVAAFGGMTSVANAVTVDGSGNVVVAGFLSSGSDSDLLVMRFTPDGSADGAFGVGGVVTTDLGELSEKATGVAIDSAGRIVVAGYWLNPPVGSKAVVARYENDGSLDATFGTGGIVQTSSPDTSGAIGSGIVLVNDLAIDASGRIVITGAFGTHVGLARYLATGVLDPSFGSGGTVLSTLSGSATGLAIDGTGRLTVAGFGMVTPQNLGGARFESDGSLDVTFGNGGVVTTSINNVNFDAAVTIDGDGRVVIAGATSYSRTAGAFVVLRYTPFGIPDPNFGVAGVATIEVESYQSDRASAVAMTTGDRILVAGTADNADFAVVALFGGGNCGNGTLDAGEDCDTGATIGAPSVCCSAACGFDGPSKVCRPSADLCDAAETCTGSSDACPAVDAAKPAGTVCRFNVGDPCDAAETCDGSSFTCPADTGSVGPDADGDGRCDAGDSCTNVGGAQDFVSPPRSKLTSTGRKLALSAAFRLPAGAPFSAFDPTVGALRLSITNAAGQPLLALEVPTSHYAGSFTYGWVQNGTGTKWTYLDKAGRIAGIKKISLSSTAPPLVKAKVKGTQGLVVQSAAELPVEVTLTLGDQTAAAAGGCGESTFGATDCGFVSLARFVCRK